MIFYSLSSTIFSELSESDSSSDVTGASSSERSKTSSSSSMNSITYLSLLSHQEGIPVVNYLDEDDSAPFRQNGDLYAFVKSDVFSHFALVFHSLLRNSYIQI